MALLINKPVRKPDELFATYVDRLAFANGYISTQEMIKHIFKQDAELSSNNFNRNQRSVYRNESLYLKITKLLNKEFDLEFFKDSTIYTGIAPFLKTGLQTSIVNSLFSQGIENRRNLIFKYVAFLTELKFCPLCMKEESEELGFYTYHTSHQFPGNHMCLIHKCRLRKLTSIKQNEYDFPLNNSKECARNGTDEMMLEYAAAIERCRHVFPNTNNNVNVKVNEKVILDIGLKSMSNNRDTVIRNLKNSRYRGLFTPQSERIFHYSRSLSNVTISAMIAGILFLHKSIDNYLDKLSQFDISSHQENINKRGLRVLGKYHPSLSCFQCKTCGTKFIETYQGLIDGFECPHCQKDLSEKVLAKEIVHKCSLGTYELISEFQSLYTLAHLKNPSLDRDVNTQLAYFIYFDGRLLNQYFTDEDCSRIIEPTIDYEFIKRNKNKSKQFELRHKESGKILEVADIKRFAKNHTKSQLFGVEKNVNHGRFGQNKQTENWRKMRYEYVSSIEGFEYLGFIDNCHEFLHKGCGKTFRLKYFYSFKNASHCRICGLGRKSSKSTFSKGHIPHNKGKKKEISYEKISKK